MLNITVSILVNMLILDGKCRTTSEVKMMDEGIFYECRLEEDTDIVRVHLSETNQNGTVYLHNQGTLLSNIHEDHVTDDVVYFDDSILDIDNREGELVLGILEEIHLDFKSFCIEADVLSKLENLKKLRIVGANFENNKAFLSGLENLRNLHLEHLPMVAIPDGFLHSQHQLHSLNYRDGGLRVLGDDTFKNLNSLEILYLHNNQLADISSDAFRTLTRLETLKLSSNKLRSLPRNLLSNLTNLQLLDLSKNELQALPSELFLSNVELRNLNLDDNQLVDIPSELFKAQTKLRRLSVRQNKLTSLPPELLWNLKKLQLLDLDGNDLTTIPDGFLKQNNHLLYLSINDNQLVNITSESLAGAPLDELFLRNNQLSTLPENLLSSHQHLSMVQLSHNTLQSLPATLLDNNNALQVFWAANNRLTNLPRFFFPRSLENLILDNNLLQIFPLNDLFKKPTDDNNDIEIKHVSLKNNSISSILTSNVTLPLLEQLDVSYNNLTDISFLHWLNAPQAGIDFSDNQITHIICDDCTYNFSLLSVSNNPIVCDFHLMDLLKEIKLHHIYHDVEGTCAEPPKYKGVEISSFNKLSVPSAAGCPEKCDCDSMVLHIKQVEVHCNGRQLTQLPEISQLSKKFEELIVRASHNRITSITQSSLQGYENVTILDVSHNQLEEIVTSKLEKLEYIDISSNKLADLNTIAQFMDQSTIDIQAAENPWVCNCETAINLFALIKPNINIKDIAQVRCSSGEELSPVLFHHICQDHKMVMLLIVILVVVITCFTVYILRNQIKSWATGRKVNSSTTDTDDSRIIF